jgi:7-keto-8-aminopelargonate synthetase-like enzyme
MGKALGSLGGFLINFTETTQTLNNKIPPQIETSLLIGRRAIGRQNVGDKVNCSRGKEPRVLAKALKFNF